MIKPPINPSQVFLGDKSMRGCFPNSFPNTKAKISFIVIKKAGK